MANKAARGTKLNCQNEECALPFYDLNVAEPDCPTCGTAYDHEAAKEPVNAGSTYRRGRQAPVFEIVAPERPAEATAEADDTTETDEDGQSDQILDLGEDDDDADDAALPGPTKETSPD